jgi:hypothetical protein
VRIKSPVALDGSQDFYALGVIVSKNGLFISDKRNVIANGLYNVVLADGSTLPATVSYVSDTDNLAIFKINPDTNHQNGFTPIVISSKDLQLGQTIIAIEGRDKNAVGIGRVVTLNTRTSKNAKGADINITYSVMTDLDPTNEIQGSMLLNLSGELVGIKSSNNDLVVPAKIYTTIAPIQSAIGNVK